MTNVRIWTRKDEREAIVSILADDTFADEDAMADAILKAAYDLLLRRDWYLTLLGEPSKPTCWAYGLSSTEGEAGKLAVMSPARVIKITSGETLKERMRK